MKNLRKSNTSARNSGKQGLRSLLDFAQTFLESGQPLKILLVGRLGDGVILGVRRVCHFRISRSMENSASPCTVLVGGRATTLCTLAVFLFFKRPIDSAGPVRFQEISGRRRPGRAKASPWRNGQATFSRAVILNRNRNVLRNRP